MKRISFCSIPAISLFLIVLVSPTVFAGEQAPYYHVQGMLGRMVIDEGDYLLEGEQGNGDAYLFEGGRVEIPILGAAVQKKLGGDQLEYGVEGGGLFSWKTDRWQVAVSNGSASIRIENSMLLADFFFGGFVATDIGERLRFYFGAGPLLIYGQQKIDPEYPEIEPYIHYQKKTESDWDVGLYTRTGIEFRFTDELIAGFGVRWVKTQLDFNNPGGKTEVEGMQFLFTLAATVFP